MIYPCLTYLDMQQAMAELGHLFGLEIVWVGDDAAEIRWNGGVAVAQTDQPEVLHGQPRRPRMDLRAGRRPRRPLRPSSQPRRSR